MSCYTSNNPADEQMNEEPSTINQAALIEETSKK